LNVTEVTSLKPDPLMMTWHPAGPLVGEKPLIDGAATAGLARPTRSRTVKMTVPRARRPGLRWGRLISSTPFS